MHLKIHPGKLSGSIKAPPSKSLTHRALILGLLADGTTTIKNPLLSDDTIATMKAVEAFGADIKQEGDSLKIRTDGLHVPEREIYVGNSGTTLRLLCGVASLLEGSTKFTGDKSISKRPIAPLLNALNQLGASCKPLGKAGSPPVLVNGVINKDRAEIRGDICSQFISSLLISCPLKNTDTTIELNTELVSPSYVGLTVDMMDKFGVKIKRSEGSRSFSIKSNQRYKAIKHEIPGDYSSAAYALVGAAITGGSIKVSNLEPESIQGDRAILEILKAAGADVRIQGSTVELKGTELSGIEVDCSDIPDLFPVLAVLGAYAKGETRLHRASHVKFKETNRLATTTEMLKAMGANITIFDEGIIIRGGKQLEGGVIDPKGDHRIFMAGAVAALGASGPTTIVGPKCHSVSYPGFLNDFKKLGVRTEEASA